MAQIKIAEYVMTNGSNVLPTLTPSTVKVTIEDTVGDSTTRILYCDETALPTAINFKNKTELLEVNYIYTSSLTSAEQMFMGCTNLKTIRTDDWNVSEMTNMSYMFYNCSSLTSLDISKFDTSEVKAINDMFRGCSKLTSLDLSSFNTEKVTSMANMFFACSSLTSLDISSFNTEKVTNMTSMFQNCSKLTSLDISSFNTEKVTNMSYMFYSCSSLTSLDISKFDTSEVKAINDMFRGCSKLTSLDLSSFNTEKVTSMANMFFACSSLTSLDISSFNTEKVTNMTSMFQNCSKLTSLDISSFNTEKVTNMSQMFQNCSKLTSLDISSFNTEKVTNMSYMFYSCSSLTSLDISSFNTEKVTNMYYMFYGCSNLQVLDLSNFNTDAVTNIGIVFDKCTALKDIGLVYCNVSTVNTIASLVPTSVECNIYYYDADETQLVKPDNVNYVKYVFPTNIQLPPHIELRSVGEVRDEIDLETGILIKRIEVDENGYPFILEEPIEEKVILNYTNSCDYGRILPTGVYDKYNVVTGEYYQTMATILLDGKNAWSEMEEMTNTIKFTATGETVEIEELNMLGAGGLYCDNDIFPNINDDSDVEHCRVDEEGNKFYIYISKERLMSPDLIGYQIWLQQNKFNMTYELAVPQNIIKSYEELDSTQAR